MVRFLELQKKSTIKAAEVKSPSAQEATPQTSTSLNAADWYHRVGQFLEHTLVKVHQGEKLDVSEGEQLASEIVRAQDQGCLPQELLIWALHGKADSSFLATNAGSITLYAILLGSTLGWPRERLEELGLAALLHNIGKIMVVEKILYKRETLDKEELHLIRQYPYETYKILLSLGEKYQHIAECGLHVNERIDGSGYPQGLQGNEINSYAQIIGLLAVYDDLTHNRSQKPKLTHFDAIKEILKTQKKAFRREYLKALINTLSIFPIHSLVKLNTGAIGRVIQTNVANPLRPKIEIVLDAQNRQMRVPRTLDLRQQPVLYVVEAVKQANLCEREKHVS